MVTVRSTIEIPAEDKARLARLYEEVRGRVQEITLIISRLTANDQRDKQESSAEVLTFVLTDNIKALQPEHLVQAATSHSDDDPGDLCICTEDRNGCGCYNYTKGICHPC